MKVVIYRVFEIHRKGAKMLMSLSTVRISADRAITDTGWCTVEEFVERLREERGVTTKVYPGAEMLFDDLGAARIGEIIAWAVEPTERAKEILDAQRFLRGETTSAEKCIAALRSYLAGKGRGDTLEKLRTAYLDVPAHRRRYLLGDMDHKDHPIGAILEGRETPEQLAALSRNGQLGHIWDDDFRPAAPAESSIQDFPDM